ncbi:FAD-dependent oxidoreductase [Ideonella sp. BN130291]|uniref:FAD-dependent oxidoreductase n=1 Tax=Ideonella sp. BN130291 TaxID=3112940 RepID=UPI002E26700D|nr:FAD-dependent oxidoreductase [Ideonella sp. BN130291]
MDIGIAGAGLLGRLLAWRLARARHRVTVFDPAAGPERGLQPAAGFSAAGMLSPTAELDGASPLIGTLGWQSLQLWPRWLAELQRPVHYAQRGSLVLAHAGDRPSAMRWLARVQAQSPREAPRPLQASELLALEPAVASGLLGWHLAGEAAIHPVQAMDALASAGDEAGVRWQCQHTVQQVTPGQLDGQRFDHVFDVRGVGARPALPVRGVRGEIFWLHAPGVALVHPLRLLHPRHRVYLVPRPRDIVVVGASEIESEDRSPVSLRSTLELLSAAHSVLPALAEARIVHSETNLRPALPDHLPRVHKEPGLTRINGLYRHGWLLAPALVQQAIGEMT